MWIRRNDGRTWRWTCRKVQYRLLKKGLRSFWIAASGMQWWCTLSHLGSQFCSRLAVVPDADWQRGISIPVAGKCSLPFPCVTILLVWMHTCRIKTAFLPMIWLSRADGWSSGAWWPLGWAGQCWVHRLALLEHYSSTSWGQASFEGVAPQARTEKGIISVGDPRKLDTSSAACCRVVVWALVSPLSPLDPVPTGPRLPHAGAGSMAEERALFYTLIYSPAWGQLRPVPAPYYQHASSVEDTFLNIF